MSEIQELKVQISDLEKRLEQQQERLNFLLTAMQIFNSRRFIEAPPTGKVRIYKIPVAHQNEDGEIIPMEFLTPDGVKSLKHLNVFCVEEPK